MHWKQTYLRLIAVLCYASALFMFAYVYPTAAKAYNDLCSSKGITFGDGYSIEDLICGLIALAIPSFFARSNPLIVINVVLAVVTVAGAISLFSTAGNVPYECFTVNGWYEDRTSGLDGFDWWLLFVGVLSYIALLIDLLAWSIRRVIALRHARLSKGRV